VKFLMPAQEEEKKNAITEGFEVLGKGRIDSFKDAEKLVNGVSAAIPYVSTAVALFDWIFGEEENQLTLEDVYNNLNKTLMEIENKLDDLRSAVIKYNAVLQTTIIQTNLSLFNSCSTTCYENARNYTFPPDDPTFDIEALKFKFIQSLNPAQDALSSLGDPIWYKRLYVEEWLYKAWNGQRMKPPELPEERDPEPGESGEQLEIWDYQFVLPVYLGIIARFLFSTHVENPNYNTWLSFYKDNILIAANKLKEFHDRIEDAIKEIPTEDFYYQLPPPDDSNVYKDSGSLYQDKKAHFVSRRLKHQIYCGAVECYTGINCVESYKLLTDFELNKLNGMYDSVSSGVDVRRYEEYESLLINSFTPRLAIRFHKKKMEVYNAAGLPNIWNIVQDLYRMIGEPLPERRIHSLGRSWSIQEVTELISISSKSKTVSLRNLAKILGASPTSFRKILDDGIHHIIAY
jgi:hypothetical protein